MNPQNLEGFSYLDKDGQRIAVLGPIEPDDTRVQLEREDGKRWGCRVEYLKDLYMKKHIDGACLRQALLDYLIATGGPTTLSHRLLPNEVPIEIMPNICSELGLHWQGSGQATISTGMPIIVIYKTRLNKAHAEFTCNIERYLYYDIVGIIRSKDDKR